MKNITIELTNKKIENFFKKFLAFGWIISLIIGAIMFVQYVFAGDVLAGLIRLIIILVIGMLLTIGFYSITLGITDVFLFDGVIDELMENGEK